MSFSLQGIALRYDDGYAALTDITLSAQQGENIALVGPSGAGKTSLLATLGTALQPTAGLLTVLEQPAWQSAQALRALRARIGTVHQSAPIPARQRVVTAVLAGRLGQWPAWKSLVSLLYPIDISGARKALERVHLEEKIFARSDQLSGGQLQRVSIARVLYQQAQLILADEPVSALDPALALDIVQLLVQEAKARNATLVASLHNVDLARSCFERLVGIRAGRIMFDLPAAQVSSAQLKALYASADDVSDASGVPSAQQETVDVPLHGCGR